METLAHYYGPAPAPVRWVLGLAMAALLVAWAYGRWKDPARRERRDRKRRYRANRRANWN